MTSTPRCRRGSRHADELHPGAAARPGDRALEPDPANLRALRVLHCDLPDVPGARRRARLAQGPHLPDQGHARSRPAGRREDGQAHRSLPQLPRLHDDLPVGRALHAPRRPCARIHRGDLPPAAAGAGAALDAREDPALSAALPLRAPGRAARAAVRAADAGAAPGDAGARAEGSAARSPAPRAAGVSGRGAAAPAGGAAGRLRAAGPRPADQRRHDPPPHPARLRGGAGGGGRLLRGADPPHGQDAREPRLGGEERPGLDARSPGRGARRDRDQHQRLRHDGQGLRPHVPRHGHGGGRGAGRGAGLRHHRDHVRPRAAGKGDAAAQGRLPRRLLAAARSADPDPAEGALEGRRLRGGGAARQPSLLRLGRDLQPDAARDLGASSAPARWRRSRSGIPR